MSANKLLKNLAGRLCDQKMLPQRFLAQPDGLHGLGPCAALAAQFFISLLISAFICVHLRLEKGIGNWSVGVQPVLRSPELAGGEPVEPVEWGEVGCSVSGVGCWTLNVECWMLGESP
jgi:hypothetical protein